MPKLSLFSSLFLPCPLCASHALFSNSQSSHDVVWSFPLPNPLLSPANNKTVPPRGHCILCSLCLEGPPLLHMGNPCTLFKPQVCFVSMSPHLPMQGLHGVGTDAHSSLAHLKVVSALSQCSFREGSQAGVPGLFRDLPL